MRKLAFGQEETAQPLMQTVKINESSVLGRCWSQLPRVLLVWEKSWYPFL